MRFAYVNGRFCRHGDAAIHVEDRGFQFADAVYEVWSVRNGQLMDADGHFGRLARSLGELRIPEPRCRPALEHIIRELLRRNRVRDGLVYLQVSRGQARRDHAFPKKPITPTIVLTCKRLDFAAADARAATGIAVITVPDERWARCDIKTVNLLPNVLAKQMAVEAGAVEAWQVDADGFITEGSSTNAWIVTKAGTLLTRQADHGILHGITRARIIECAQRLGLDVVERAFTPEDALDAREAFLTSATSFVTPVVSIDNNVIANGEPGSLTSALREAYLGEA
ncbi:D-amino-acid transaminase [Maricaulis maris]|uniref:Probable branched-chain-amino-acid aminotransferase n=1 Tax=Maricaulis maris TaxID=74318 RepID=A0A495DJK2_9PROT|nr:D-amino-acid transaminase [Maricaulis maris]RKR02804.1 D-alanine transaminase [Maricaulis maris]